MFHLLAYLDTTGGAVTLADSTALVDSEISQRNGHYVLTEQYNLLGASVNGATVTEGQIYVPSFNAVTAMNIWPLARSLTIQSPPRFDWRASYPPPIPMNEEIQAKVSDTASEDVYTFMWLGAQNWNLNLPRGMDPVPIFVARFSITQAVTLRIWNPLAQLTLEQSLRGGTYAVVGAELVGANGLAFRLVFPRAPMYNNRKLRPGKLMQQALGDLPMGTWPHAPYMFGEWGRFSTYELPQVETLFNATNTSATFTGMLYLVRLGENPSVLY